MFAGFLNLSCFLKEESLSQSVNQTSRSAYDLVRWNNRKDMITETGLGDWSFVMEILPLSWIRNWTVPTKWAQLVHSSYWRALNSVSAKSLKFSGWKFVFPLNFAIEASDESRNTARGSFSIRHLFNGWSLWCKEFELNILNSPVYIINMAVHLLTIAAKYRSHFLINRINTTVTLTLGLKLGVNRVIDIVDPEYRYRLTAALVVDFFSPFIVDWLSFFRRVPV